MKKKKIKKILSLNKQTIAVLGNNQKKAIKGGVSGLNCVGETEYPRCGISGCIGAQSCFPDTGPTFCLCG